MPRASLTHTNAGIATSGQALPNTWDFEHVDVYAIEASRAPPIEVVAFGTPTWSALTRRAA